MAFAGSYFMRNALACVGKKERPIVTAALRTAFDQDTLADSKDHWAKPPLGPSCLMNRVAPVRDWGCCPARHLCRAAAEVGPFPSWSVWTVSEYGRLRLF